MRKLREIPLMIKVTLPVCLLFAALIVGLFFCAFQKERAKQTAAVGDGQLVTESTEEALLTYAEEETETEALSAEEPESEAAVAEYVSFAISGESVEKDLTLYFKGSDNTKISGVSFSVKLADPEMAESLEEFQEKLDALDEALDGAEEESAAMALSRERLSERLGTDIPSREAQLIERKQAVITAYAGALEALEGEIYTDDDQDGMIEIASIEPGDYSVCYIPLFLYDASRYVSEVNVKDQIEYKVVESIQDKTVSDQVAGDIKQTHADTVVEQVQEDTVIYEESTQSTTDAEYEKKEGFTITLLPEVSEELAESASECEVIADTDSETQDESETAAVVCAISISKSVTLYAVEGAESADIAVTPSNVSSESLSLPDSLQDVLTAEAAESGYRISVKDPASVLETVNGELVYSALDASGNTLSVTCAVEIVGGDTPLTDDEGNELYIQDADGGMVAATVANYQPDNSYYVKVKEGTVVYFGWQNIDGAQYYFDEDGNAVTGVQVIGGVEYHFRPDGSLMTDGYGIDVSKWQGDIDWSKASTVISFAIIRCGFRGTSGKLAEDSYAAANIAGARANGVKVGLYFYSTAMTEAQAVEEASLAVSIARANGGLDLPIYIDMEDSCQLSLTTAQRDAIVLAFCKTVQSSGYSAGVYANKNWLTTYLTPSKYSGLSVWCAQYNTTCTYSGTYDIWQYSCTGTIPGISGYVDLDKGYF